MSHTLHPLHRQRPRRSGLAVPRSNPGLIEKAAGSAADHRNLHWGPSQFAHRARWRRR